MRILSRSGIFFELISFSRSKFSEVNLYSETIKLKSFPEVGRIKSTLFGIGGKFGCGGSKEFPPVKFYIGVVCLW